MSADSRDRVTVDLRGLAPAVKAHASARNMTLAAFARAAMVEALKHAEVDPFHMVQEDGLDDGRPVKLTLSLPLRQASWLAGRACAGSGAFVRHLSRVCDRRHPSARRLGRRSESAHGVDQSTRRTVGGPQ